MRIAAIKHNDTVNGTGVCVSLWVQGCPIHCPGCHNEHLWDFKGGTAKPMKEIIDEIDEALTANGVKRNFSILGGEPLCDEHFLNVAYIVRIIRKLHPDIKIHVWTGYDYDELWINLPDENLKEFLNNINYLICGPYKQELRDITLKWRGSSNQEILEVF